MSLSADPRYRSVHLTWRNYDAAGGETVRWWAKPSGGAWGIVMMMPVASDEQAADWDTALPLTAYDIALQFVNGTVATVGYEGEPDDWTASTAALSKSTVTTTCASVTGLAGTFVDAATPLALSWTCAQTGITFLLEKNLGAGWVTVESGITAQSYQYTIPSAELNTTVDFRVTSQVGAVSGTVSDTLSVYVGVLVGAPTITAATFNPVEGSLSLSWSAADDATAYTIEHSINGAAYVTYATVTGLSFALGVGSVGPGRRFEPGYTVRWRVTGTNGAYVGTSAVSDLVTLTVVTPAVTMVSLTIPASHSGTFCTTTTPTGDWYMTGVELSQNGGGWFSGGGALAPATDIPINTAHVPPAGQTLSARARAYACGGNVIGALSNEITETSP